MNNSLIIINYKLITTVGPTYVRMLLIYYSSEFNTIVPAKLVLKLRSLGLNSSLCNWILDFMMGRPQVVRKGSLTSSVLTLSTGAPQGCVLSPLLYRDLMYKENRREPLLLDLSAL